MKFVLNINLKPESDVMPPVTKINNLTMNILILSSNDELQDHIRIRFSQSELDFNLTIVDSIGFEHLYLPFVPLLMLPLVHQSFVEGF